MLTAQAEAQSVSCRNYAATVQPAVKPRVAIISVGDDNPYGHPNAELLERLAGANVRVLRTDRDGAVHVLMSGKGLEVTCFVPCLPMRSDDLQRAQAPSHHKNQQQQ